MECALSLRAQIGSLEKWLAGIWCKLQIFIDRNYVLYTKATSDSFLANWCYFVAANYWRLEKNLGTQLLRNNAASFF